MKETLSSKIMRFSMSPPIFVLEYMYPFYKEKGLSKFRISTQVVGAFMMWSVISNLTLAPLKDYVLDNKTQTSYYCYIENFAPSEMGKYKCENPVWGWFPLLEGLRIGYEYLKR